MNENSATLLVSELKFFKSHKPYTRWWWFSGEIKKEDIIFQLEWLKRNNFGGVEIAWIYPISLKKTNGYKLYDKPWCELVAFTKHYCDKIGLGCDFTYGSLWPFGGSFIPEELSIKLYNGYSPQRLDHTWEMAYNDKPFYIIDHLKRDPLEYYAEIVGKGLCDAMKGSKSGLFEDSWEVLTEGLWTDGFDEEFEARFGYDIKPYMPEIHKYPDIRYDYRKLIAEYIVREHYAPFTEICNRQGGFSRVQCHGSPTDLIRAYSVVDVPESEAILFDADFSVITASSAALAGKNEISCETFTCLYGWVPRPGPAPFSKKEHMADLKMIADAVFANGVNQIIWHGMPFNPQGGNNEFYATVHVGYDSQNADEFAPFNEYMEKISAIMKLGKTYCEVAAWLPIEDTWMVDRLPKEMEKISAIYHWEMQYTYLPAELKGYHALWVSNYFLKDATYFNGKMQCGKATFSVLYIDAEYVDYEALMHICRLAKQGLPVCIKKQLKQPGKNKNPNYNKILDNLFALRNVSTELKSVYPKKPLIEGENLPDFWCRVHNDDLYIFIAHPKAQGIRYPMKYGQSVYNETLKKLVTIHYNKNSYPYELIFKPYQSLLLKLSKNKIEQIKIEYTPQNI